MRTLWMFVLAVVLFLLTGLMAFAQEDKGRAYYDFGVFAYEDGRYEDAETNLKTALQFNPQNPFYNHFLGKTYLKMERYKDANAYLTQTWQIDSSMSELKYDLAYVYYKTSDFAKAGNLFKEVIKEEPANVLARYYAGICLYNQNLYEQAADYFITAANQSPSISTNGRYYAGVCYQKTGKTQKAIEMFEYVKEHADSQSLKENAQVWLQTLKKQEETLKPYNIYLKISRQYDDNVQLEPVNQDIYANEADWATVGFFSGKYNFYNRKDFQIGAGYSHYQIWYDDLNSYNLTGSMGNFYAKYRLNAFTFGFSYLPEYFWLDSQSYLRRHQFKPEVIWGIGENLFVLLSYSYYIDKYFQDQAKDGHTHEVSTDVYYTLMEGKLLLFGGIGYEDNTASNSDQYYSQWKTKIGASVKLPWELEAGITLKYYDKQYDYVDSFYGVERDDSKYYGSISLSRKLYYDWLNIAAEFNYTKNDSNISDFNYKRKVTTLSLTAAY